MQDCKLNDLLWIIKKNVKEIQELKKENKRDFVLEIVTLENITKYIQKGGKRYQLMLKYRDIIG